MGKKEKFRIKGIPRTKKRKAKGLLESRRFLLVAYRYPPNRKDRREITKRMSSQTVKFNHPRSFDTMCPSYGTFVLHCAGRGDMELKIPKIKKNMKCV